MSRNYWACVPQLLKPTSQDPMLHNKRSHHSEKPTHYNKEQLLLATTRESLCKSNEDRVEPKKKKRMKSFLIF